MAKRSGRTAFWLGFLVYAVSFFLSFVGGPGVYTPKPPSGADCAFDWFFFPWIYVHWHSMASFLTDAPIENVSIAISGWINPAFFLAAILQVIGKTPRLSKVLRYVTLLMLPFSWVLFLDQHVYPREGYFLWIGAMLLVLFSTELETGNSRWNQCRLKNLFTNLYAFAQSAFLTPVSRTRTSGRHWPERGAR